ncbi:unnamed protein product, partial [Ectocarpus sp. 12 AP-2014]
TSVAARVGTWPPPSPVPSSTRLWQKRTENHTTPAPAPSPAPPSTTAAPPAQTSGSITQNTVKSLVESYKPPRLLISRGVARWATATTLLVAGRAWGEWGSRRKRSSTTTNRRWRRSLILIRRQRFRAQSKRARLMAAPWRLAGATRGS